MALDDISKRRIKNMFNNILSNESFFVNFDKKDIDFIHEYLSESVTYMCDTDIQEFSEEEVNKVLSKMVRNAEIFVANDRDIALEKKEKMQKLAKDILLNFQENLHEQFFSPERESSSEHRGGGVIPIDFESRNKR